MPFWRRKAQDESSSTSSNASSISQPDGDQHQQQQQQHEQQLELQLEQPIPPPDIGPSSSNGEATAAAEQQQQQPDSSPADVNPMLQTSLTKRFQGRFHPMQMPTYDLMMQVSCLTTPKSIHFIVLLLLRQPCAQQVSLGRPFAA
jgi:hypothetical protein